MTVLSHTGEWVRMIALGVLFLLLSTKPFEIIPEGSRGLMFNMGKIDNKELSPGFKLRMPLAQEIKLVSLRPIQFNLNVEVGVAGAITKDNQTIGASLIFFYKFKEGELVKMYSKFGEDKIKSIITTSGVESFKAEIGNHDIFSLPTKQDIIRNSTLVMVRTKMAEYPIEVMELKITNYDWSDGFDKQISETMERAQQVSKRSKSS